MNLHVRQSHPEAQAGTSRSSAATRGCSPGPSSASRATPADGDEVDLVSHGGNFVARGLFNSQSKIRVRLYSWEAGVPLDRDFFRDRLAPRDPPAPRRPEAQRPEPGYRVVFSESDYLSGMVVDRYGDWLAVQFTALGLANRREMIADVLRELLNPRGIYLRTEKGIGKLEGVELARRTALGRAAAGRPDHRGERAARSS